jgi:hypothetical protein
VRTDEFAEWKELVSSPGRALSAIATEKMLAVEKGLKGPESAPAPIAKFIDLPRVESNRNPNPAMRLADQVDALGDVICPVVENRRPAAVIREFPIGRGPGQILPIIVDNQHLDRLAIVH